MASIQIRNVTKAYGAFVALQGVSIDIPDGEFVTLVGPSGCGKSTLLRMIAGLDDIKSGDILIGDKLVNDLPAKDRDIAMVFQSYALYPHMTVEKNMGFALKLARRSKQEIDAAVNAAAEILGLGPLLQRKPAQLSGGQRQRVAMGRAIVRDPAVFLFDEPLSNLDAQLRVQMRGEIKSLHHRLKTTTVYVTHDQVEAMTMADRIVVMSAGRVEQVGRPLELFDRPANLFVARFIGSPQMNVVNGRIENEQGATIFRAPGWRLTLAAPYAEMAGREVALGLRPDQVSLANAGDTNAITGVVQVLEPTGTETLISLEVEGKPFLSVLRERVEAGPGEALSLAVRPDRAHLFDLESGQRIDLVEPSVAG